MSIKYSETLSENIRLGKHQAYFYELSQRPIFNIIEQRRLAHVIANLAEVIERNQPVLDIESGTGNLVRHLQRCGFRKIIACDVSVDMLRENSSEYIVICDACPLPFKKDPFAFITAYSMLHSLPAPEKGLKERIRVASKNSTLYFDRLPFLMKPLKGLDSGVCKIMEIPAHWCWLILNPKYLKRHFKRFFTIYNRRKQRRDQKKFSVETIAPYMGGDKNAILGEIFFKILREEGFVVETVRYRLGSFVRARRLPTSQDNKKIGGI